MKKSVIFVLTKDVKSLSPVFLLYGNAQIEIC